MATKLGRDNFSIGRGGNGHEVPTLQTSRPDEGHFGAWASEGRCQRQDRTIVPGPSELWATAALRWRPHGGPSTGKYRPRAMTREVSPLSLMRPLMTTVKRGGERGGSKAFCARSREIGPDSRLFCPYPGEQFRPELLQGSDANTSISVASGDSLHKLLLHLHLPLRPGKQFSIIPSCSPR